MLQKRYVLEFKDLIKITKVTKNRTVLLVFHMDCFCRHNALYVHIIVTCDFLFQKWPLGGVLKNSWRKIAGSRRRIVILHLRKAIFAAHHPVMDKYLKLIVNVLNSISGGFTYKKRFTVIHFLVAASKLFSVTVFYSIKKVF